MPSTPSTILYHGSNSTDSTLTFSINGTRWEYFLHPQDFMPLEWLARRYIRKAFAQAKRRAYRSEKVKVLT